MRGAKTGARANASSAPPRTRPLPSLERQHPSRDITVNPNGVGAATGDTAVRHIIVLRGP
jgi:hypothetical protein